MIGDGSQFMGKCHNRSRLANSAIVDDVDYDLRRDDGGVEDVTNRATYGRLEVLVMMPELRRGQEKQNRQGKTSQKPSAI